jgi:hypothetical protein
MKSQNAKAMRSSQNAKVNPKTLNYARLDSETIKEDAVHAGGWISELRGQNHRLGSKIRA